MKVRILLSASLVAVILLLAWLLLVGNDDGGFVMEAGVGLVLNNEMGVALLSCLEAGAHRIVASAWGARGSDLHFVEKVIVVKLDEIVDLGVSISVC